ncbi:MAG: 3-deoxy-7-phosphoheptulonate synthase AroG [Gammaproteobacteria bacterium]|nr:3-deoxy-7-phosphoheptulonate synthase AroG [Gammaproteobacteria bacterium]
MLQNTDDLRIEEIKAVATPIEICEEISITEQAADTTHDTRMAIQSILAGNDDRLLVITGPCSIHDTDAAIEYGKKLKALIEKYKDNLLIVMRVYFEKPRTTVGWKGLINDPDLDESFKINKGLRLARQLLLDLNNEGIPAGVEYLDVITPQYVADLVSWGAIGARTTESQVHRELASGLSCPVGFKNGTDGTIQIAVDAIRAAAARHHFLSLRKEGSSAIFTTHGNSDCHVILRGGKEPNYDADSIDSASQQLEKAGLPPRIMVDFSHANSSKQHKNQLKVADDISTQLNAGETRIFGVMIESHLNEGRQENAADKELQYGVSITDACIGWDDTEKVIEQLSQAVENRRNKTN